MRKRCDEKVIPDWMRKPNIWAYYPLKKKDTDIESEEK